VNVKQKLGGAFGTSRRYVEVCGKTSVCPQVLRPHGGFQSDQSQPIVFRGNTCAHEMNVSSTATVLPPAPSDVDDLLSVVFTGSQKFKPEYLGNMYRSRKAKVRRFLKWLKVHNQAHVSISLDKSAADPHPEDGHAPPRRLISDPDPSKPRVPARWAKWSTA